MKINIGTAILLAMIGRVSNSSQGNQHIVSLNGTTQAFLGIDMVDEKPWISIQNFDVGPTVKWSGETLYVENIPDTIIASLPGKKLRDFFSHPAFDQFDIAIDYISTSGSELYIGTNCAQVEKPDISILDLAQSEIARLQTKA